jgi:hypothetical protein
MLVVVVVVRVSMRRHTRPHLTDLPPDPSLNSSWLSHESRSDDPSSVLGCVGTRPVRCDAMRHPVWSLPSEATKLVVSNRPPV